MSTSADLLRAIAHNPAEDTPRLMYADHLDELGGEMNSARAEFIRLDIAMSRLEELPMSQYVFRFNPLDAERCRAMARECGFAWKAPCVECASEGYHTPDRVNGNETKCDRCKGSGRIGQFVRGFPVVKCKLEEVLREDEGMEWTPTKWAVECVRIGASFEVTDREPHANGYGHAFYNVRRTRPSNDVPTVAVVPETVFVAMYELADPQNDVVSTAGRFVACPTAVATIALLNAAVHRLVVRAAFPTPPAIANSDDL